ncbi:MAG TPA: hypothetical protein VGN93_06250 [Shinella sp.]|jgi:hypothetical protein|uniref:hypothetical protein n=1 Tax=Shinella sp. TaxID=1870904 RepID=UPI002E11C6A1|nr:hypothetical protein [Shinella sp.]
MAIKSGYTAEDLARLGPDELTRRRRMAEALALKAGSPREIKHPLQGFAQLADALIGGLQMKRLDEAEKIQLGQREEGNKALLDYAFSGGGSTGSSTTMPAGEAEAELSATTPGTGTGGNYRDAIASIESKGSGGYAAVGPTHDTMGRALGRYQVMEANIPQWSKEALGREVTADEFLANPELQDAIFDNRFGKYVDKYGPEGAAQAWFGGEGGVGKLDRKDSLGTTIGAYTDKFRNAMGGQTGQQEVASLDPTASLSQEVADFQQSPEYAQQFPGMDAQKNTPQNQQKLAQALLVGEQHSSGRQRDGTTSLDAVNAMATGGRPEGGPRIAMFANALLSGGEQSDNPIEAQRNAMIANALIGQDGNQMPIQGGEMPVDASGLPPEFQRSAQLQTAMQRPEGSIIQALMGGTPADPAQLAQARAAGMSGQGINGGMPEGGDKRQLIENLMRNPATQEIGQRLLLQEMEQRAQANDPMRALELQKLRRDVERGQPMINLGDGRLFDPNTREFLNAPGSETMEAPEVKEFFDESGMPYKAAWNPRSGQWEKVGNSKAPNGTRLEVDPATGAVTFTQGAGVKPLTEQQSKDTVYSVRAEGALPLIDKLGDSLTSLPEAVGGQVPGIGNYLKSPEYQQAEQAGREFLAAILRKDTGAAITPSEMEDYGSVYLPRPGDSAEVLTQKQQSRSRALAALKAGMPPQAILAQQKALAAGRDALGDARKAIAAGADRNAVIQRLKENGIDPEGL